MRLAVVEDEVILVMAMTVMLEDWGHEVVGTAGTEKGAAAMVAAVQPDAVLMDVRLGRNDCGIAAARAIRRDFDVPVVFCTACADSETVQAEVRALGNAHLIGKPIDEDRLRSVLRSIAHRTPKRPILLASPEAALEAVAA